MDFLLIFEKINKARIKGLQLRLLLDRSIENGFVVDWRCYQQYFYWNVPSRNFFCCPRALKTHDFEW